MVKCLFHIIHFNSASLWTTVRKGLFWTTRLYMFILWTSLMSVLSDIGCGWPPLTFSSNYYMDAKPSLIAILRSAGGSCRSVSMPGQNSDSNFLMTWFVTTDRTPMHDHTYRLRHSHIFGNSMASSKHKCDHHFLSFIHICFPFHIPHFTSVTNFTILTLYN